MGLQDWGWRGHLERPKRKKWAFGGTLRVCQGSHHEAREAKKKQSSWSRGGPSSPRRPASRRDPSCQDLADLDEIIQPGRPQKKKTVKLVSGGSIIARMPRLPAGHQLSGPSRPRRNNRSASRTNYPRNPARETKKNRQAGLGGVHHRQDSPPPGGTPAGSASRTNYPRDQKKYKKEKKNG